MISLSRFDTILDCDRQMDRQMNSIVWAKHDSVKQRAMLSLLVCTSSGCVWREMNGFKADWLLLHHRTKHTRTLQVWVHWQTSYLLLQSFRFTLHENTTGKQKLPRLSLPHWQKSIMYVSLSAYRTYDRHVRATLQHIQTRTVVHKDNRRQILLQLNQDIAKNNYTVATNTRKNSQVFHVFPQP